MFLISFSWCIFFFHNYYIQQYFSTVIIYPLQTPKIRILQLCNKHFIKWQTHSVSCKLTGNKIEPISKASINFNTKMEINTYTRCSVAWYNMLPMASVMFDRWRILNLFSNRCLKAFIRPIKAKMIVGILDIVL
jgi:hypothetical protein